MIDPFGVDRTDLSKQQVSPASSERAKHYGRMAGTMGTLGGSAATVGAGAGLVGLAERRGHDPMSFTTAHTSRTRPLTGTARSKVLASNTAAHAWQAKRLGAVGATGLGLGAAYKYKQRKELEQPVARLPSRQMMGKAVGVQADPNKRRASDIGLGAASAGLAVPAASYGLYEAKFLNRAANKGMKRAVKAQRAINLPKKAGTGVLAPSALRFQHQQIRTGLKTAAIKKPGAALAAGAAGAGAVGLGELGRHALATRRLNQGQQ